MPETRHDTPGIVVAPPLLGLGVLAVGRALDWLLPVALLDALALGLRIVLGIALFAAGLALIAAGGLAFKRAGTNVDPYRPALKVADSGVFAHLRNPMYVGMGLALLGIALGFALEWTLALTVAASFVIHFGVVLREERYLEKKFGEEYRCYKARVPRYGWRF